VKARPTTMQLPVSQILRGSSLNILPTLPSASIDLIFADPPYNLQLHNALWRPNHTQVDAVDDDWDQFDDFAAYDQFTHSWLLGARHVMKDTATLWVSGTYHNIFRVGAIMQELGFWILNTITWFKPNAMPNFRGIRLKNDVEFVIWAKYSQSSRYTFNHHAMKQYNDGKQLGSVWTIPVCGGQERMKNADGRKLHPTQKPEALITRILLASSKPGDVVLDPFLGSGTTAAVAKRMHRNWIGIEQDETYIGAAQARIDTVQPLFATDPLLDSTADEKTSRIPFAALLKNGLLAPGQQLYLDTPDCTAIILDTGLLQVGDLTGSIHRIGALLKKAPSCNGWTHWLYLDEQTGERHPIDRLRKGMRQLPTSTVI
jgi:modification methylase